MSEENLSEVLAVRREKLKKLQEEGKNPFEMTRYDVTAYADDVNENFEAYEEKPVSMAGRFMARRGQERSASMTFRTAPEKSRCS